MPNAALPTKLAKEPIIDVVFEFRFASSQPAVEIFPSILFSKIPNLGRIEPLPAGQIPAQMRAADPNLQFASLLRIHWGQIQILIGDNIVAISCSMPYVGWTKLQSAILTVFNLLNEANIVTHPLRCAVKYTDMLDDNGDNEASLLQLNFSLHVGNNHPAKGGTFIRTEVHDEKVFSTVQISTFGSVQLHDGTIRNGVIIDIDTVYRTLPNDGASFFGDLPKIADDLHSSNKVLFFELLSSEGLAKLEPIYE